MQYDFAVVQYHFAAVQYDFPAMQYDFPAIQYDFPAMQYDCVRRDCLLQKSSIAPFAVYFLFLLCFEVSMNINLFLCKAFWTLPMTFK